MPESNLFFDEIEKAEKRRNLVNFDLESHTIYKCIHGSRAYGTYIETSDTDYKGVAIAPLDYYLGCTKNFEQAERYVNKGHDRDETIYDIKKFMKLASACNPNIIEVLYCREQDIIWPESSFLASLGTELRQNRDIFLSKKAKNTFSGYALAQLKRINGHRKWLLNPPTKKPERSDFGLPVQQKISSSEINAYESMKGEITLDDNIMLLLQNEKRYVAAKRDWDAFERWKKERNKDRAKDEAAFGFDLKHACHLVRLLRMGKEILSGSGVIVFRPDAEELLSIRKGEWSYEKILQFAEEEIKEINSICEKSSLPDAPDPNKIDDLCMNLIWKFHQVRI